MYHNIAKPPKEALLKSLYVKPRDFKRQVKFFKLLGYRFRTLEKVEKKTVIFTFDDAYKDFLENAYPVLEKFGFKAYLFVPVSFVGRFNLWDYEKLKVKKFLMDWEDLRFLVKEGYKIGSHTLTHPYLTELTDKELKKELEYSKKLLEDKLGIFIDSLCYPYGAYDQRVIKFTKEAGYRFAFTTKEAKFSLKNPYEIPRINIFGEKFPNFLNFLKRVLRY